MNEAQERNLIRFVIGNSFPLDQMHEEYLVFCAENGLKEECKDRFALTILREGYRIVVIEKKAFVFGALRRGDTRQKSSVYVKGTPPVEKAEWNRWMEEHAWEPEF